MLLGTVPSGTGATSGAATGSNWPQFQYDAANTGYNPDAEGPTRELTERWSFSTFGEVVSSPAVVDGTVFVGSKDGKLYALDAKTGEKQWEYATGAGIQSSPAVDGTTVYIGNQAGEVFAISIDGIEQWSEQFDGAISSALNVADGRLFVVINETGTLVTLNASNGSEVWRVQIDRLTDPVALDGPQVFAVSKDYISYSYGAADGEQNWYKANYTDYTPSSPPTYNKKTVYKGSRNGIEAINSSDGTLRWHSGFADPIHSDANCLSVAVRNRTLYAAVSLDSAGYALAFDTVTGDRQWRVELPNSINSAPVLAGDHIYFGCDDNNVYSLEQSDGTTVSSYQTGSAVRSTPAISGGAVFVGSQDGYVYALEDLPPNEEPVARFSYSPSPVVTGRESTFDASNASDPDGTIERYGWDFDGNGATDAEGETATKTFSNSGEQTVTLTVTDDRGATASTSKTVTINAAPEPAFSYTPTVPDPDESVSFEAATSTDPDGTIDEYAWEFDDDGQVEATGQQVTHTFGQGGEYLVSLSVTDNDGTTAVTSQTVSVNESPRAAFSVSPERPAAGQTVTFDAAEAVDPGGSVDRYEWDFDGDGSADATGETATRQYDSSGEFTVALTVVGSNGMTDTAEATITVVEARDTSTATRPPATARRPGSGATNDGGATPADRSSSTPTSAESTTGPANGGGGSNEETDGGGGGLGTGMVGAATGGAALLGGGALWLRSRSNDGDSVSQSGDGTTRPGDGQMGADPSTGEGNRPTMPSVSGTLDADFDDFEQIELLGSGGSGDVHKARIAVDGKDRLVALKTPRVHNYQTIDAAFATEFLQEAETWSEIDDHDHVVDVLDWGHSPQPWIAMEYMNDNSLTEHLPLDLDDGIEVLTAVADATQYAHRHGIAHGDLKPENVLFGATGDSRVVKVGDWGLAKVLLDHSDSTQGLTPAYAAPEQFEGSNRDARDHQLSDIYQLGALAYAAFTGKPPYDGSPAEVMNKVLNEAPTPPSETDQSLPSAVDELVLRAMSKNPDDRYPTAQHFRDALTDALDSL